MGRDRKAAGHRAQHPPVRSAMVVSHEAAPQLAFDATICVVLVLKNDGDVMSEGIARAGDLRRLEIEDDDRVKRRDPMSTRPTSRAAGGCALGWEGGC